MDSFFWNLEKMHLPMDTSSVGLDDLLRSNPIQIFFSPKLWKLIYLWILQHLDSSNMDYFAIQAKELASPFKYY